MENNCIFCKIISKAIKANVIFEDDICLGFKDANPVTPVHVLFIPKKHIHSLDTLEKEDESIIGHTIFALSRYAKEQGLPENGYRVVNNTGKDAGQTVFHIHFHLLAGKSFGWPPG
jgi:histidine triad (HIT) family protein